MSDIKFYIPEGITVPTELRLRVDGISVHYTHESGRFEFLIFVDDEDKAMEVAETIVDRIKYEQDEPQHGVSWRTESLKVVPQEARYKIGTIVEWRFRVRDSY